MIKLNLPGLTDVQLFKLLVLLREASIQCNSQGSAEANRISDFAFAEEVVLAAIAYSLGIIEKPDFQYQTAKLLSAKQSHDIELAMLWLLTGRYLVPIPKHSCFQIGDGFFDLLARPKNE